MNTPVLPSSCRLIVQQLKQHHCIDFACYQPAALLRRIDQRMQQLGIIDYADYAEYVCLEPNECDRLVHMLLINHTSFLRDPEVWAALMHEHIPQLLGSKAPGAPLRIWSAGCASGQEPYSLAILLAEYLGLEQFAKRVRIYATDVDSDALAQVHQGCYHSWAVRMLPTALLKRYFVEDRGYYQVRKELCRALIVERHNLLADAPLAEIDLLICRNVLIYFTPATQHNVIGLLRKALADQGLLVMGRADLAFPAEHGLRWASQAHQIVRKNADAYPQNTRDWQVDYRHYAWQPQSLE